jgi:hypothetical protein
MIRVVCPLLLCHHLSNFFYVPDFYWISHLYLLFVVAPIGVVYIFYYASS